MSWRLNALRKIVSAWSAILTVHFQLLKIEKRKRIVKKRKEKESCYGILIVVSLFATVTKVNSKKRNRITDRRFEDFLDLSQLWIYNFGSFYHLKALSTHIVNNFRKSFKGEPKRKELDEKNIYRAKFI